MAHKPTITWVMDSESKKLSMTGAMDYYTYGPRGHFFLKGCTVQIIQQCGHPIFSDGEPFCPHDEPPCDCAEYEFAGFGNSRTRHHHITHKIK